MKRKPPHIDLVRENKRLHTENRQLRGENAALKRRVAEREAKVDQLTAIIADLRRQGKRQAAPFSKGAPKADPKKPGRKPGPTYGKKGHRRPPAKIDETIDVPLPDKSPCCGAGIDETETCQQYQVELPRQLIHRQLDVHVGCCQACGKRVQGRHPLQTSDALGAAAAQLGPIAQAAVVWLNKHAGMSHGKVVRCFRELFGIELTKGGAVQIMLRAAECCEDAYQSLLDQARKDPVASADETGWRIGGLKAWLHVVVTQLATVYVVDPTRSAAVAMRVLGRLYAGILLRDGWAAYDAFELTFFSPKWFPLRRHLHQFLWNSVLQC